MIDKNEAQKRVHLYKGGYKNGIKDGTKKGLLKGFVLGTLTLICLRYISSRFT